MMRRHKFGDLPTKIHDEYQEEEYTDHECASMISCPLCEEWLVCMEILGLEDSETSDDHDEKEGKEIWLWYTEYEIWSCFRESFFEHLECREEDDKESDPLDRWELFEHFCDPSWCDDHKDDRYDQPYDEIHDISMTCTCDSEDIVERHRDICDDNRLDRSHKCIRIGTVFFMMLARADLTIKLPYDIEEEYSPEELESRYLEEKYDSEWEDDTEDCRTCYSPKYRFFSQSWCKFLCRHTDQYSVVSTHDEVDEDDIEECKCSCRSKNMHEVWLESHNKICHRDGVRIILL